MDLEMNILQIISLIAQLGFLKYGFKWIREYRNREKEKSEQREAEQESMNSAICCLLRTEIISICHKSEKEGFLPVWAMENLTNMYNAYIALGGNGTARKLYEKAIHLPQREG